MDQEGGEEMTTSQGKQAGSDRDGKEVMGGGEKGSLGKTISSFESF